MIFLLYQAIENDALKVRKPKKKGQGKCRKMPSQPCFCSCVCNQLDEIAGPPRPDDVKIVRDDTSVTKAKTRYQKSLNLNPMLVKP